MPAHPAHEDIVRRVSADRDAKAADHENPGEEDPGHPAEHEGEPAECLSRRARMMGQREQKRGGRDRQGTRQDLGGLQEPKHAEEDRDQDEAKERLLVDPCAQVTDQGSQVRSRGGWTTESTGGAF